MATKDLRVILNFQGRHAQLLRDQAKANYLPVTQYLRTLILRYLDTHQTEEQTQHEQVQKTDP